MGGIFEAFPLLSGSNDDSSFRAFILNQDSNAFFYPVGRKVLFGGSAMSKASLVCLGNSEYSLHALEFIVCGKRGRRRGRGGGRGGAIDIKGHKSSWFLEGWGKSIG